MKFRFVIFSLLSVFCAQPILSQITEQEMANLLIGSFIEKSRGASLANDAHEQRAQRRAKLVKQAQEIRAQMYSAKQERLLKCIAYVLMGAMVVGSITVSFCSHYMQQKGLAHAELAAAKLKQYLVDETLLTDLNAEWWHAFKIGAGTFVGTMITGFPALYFGQKLDLQKELKTKLEDIKKKIAEIDALDTTEAQNVVIA